MLTRRETMGALLASPLLASPLMANPLLAPGETRFILNGPGARAIIVSEWLPHGPPRGVILFSHGAGSSPRFYTRMIAPWVKAGHRVLAPLHVDSHEHPDTANFPGLASWRARIEDMTTLIAALGDRPFVAAGHSFGGLVALTLGGAAPIPPAGMHLPLYPRLARAVIAFSPPPPIAVLVTAGGYGRLAVPALIETGTRDIVPGITAPLPDGWQGHLAAFEAAEPGGDRYALVLDSADHYFGGAICDYDQPGPMQIAQLNAANHVCAVFLRGSGVGDAAARVALRALVADRGPVQLWRR